MNLVSNLLILSIIFSIICLILISYVYYNYDIEMYEQFKLLVLIFITSSLTFLQIKNMVEKNYELKNDVVKEMFNELNETNYKNNSLNENVVVEKH